MMSQVLRIGIDARPLAIPHNGIGRYTTNIVREFARQQSPHRIHLYSDRPFKLDFALPPQWKVRTGAIRSGGLSTAFAQVVFPFWALKDRVDVFWSPRHQLPLLLLPHIKKVLTTHDVVWKRYPQTMRRAGPIVEALLTPPSLWVANQVIADSHFTRSELISLFPWVREKTNVVYLASSLIPDGSEAPPPVAKDYLLFVGSSEPRKNIRGLLLAYKEYRAISSRPFDLVFAGSDQWGEFSVTDFIQTHGLQSSVHIFRHVDDSLLCSLYSRAKAVVMVSLYEGFGLPLVEAMQWGIPLIASNTSSLAEIAGDAAITVDPNEVDAIAWAFKKVTEDEATRSALASRSRLRGLTFSWKQAASETLEKIVRGVSQD